METTVARPMLVYALVLGVAADLLLRDGPTGIGFPIWVAVLVVGMTALLRRLKRAAPPDARAWLVAAPLFAAGLAWRQSEPLQVLDVLATGVCLAMAAVSLRDPAWMLFTARLRDALWALFRVVRTTAAGVLPVALHARLDAQSLTAGRHDAGAIARAAAISAVLLAVFGMLLIRADPIFASLLSIPQFDIGLVVSHVAVFAVFSWMVGGWSRSALSDAAIALAPERFAFTLSSLDITMSLGVLNVLFAAYVGAQFTWFFGGESYLQAQTGLTASAYARRGFFELVWVAVLVVPLILGTRAVIAPEPAVRRRHTMLALPLVAMVGAMMLSAVLRLRLYVEYYGLTTERFFALVFMGWLAVVLALVCFTMLREQARLFLAGASLTGLATLAALTVANPDVIIARVNLDRVATTQSRDAAGLDLVHLATLGGEAAATAATAVMSATTADPLERCAAARLLMSRWGPSSRRALRLDEPVAWRAWNAGERRGLAAIGRSSRALREVIHATCAPAPSAAPAVPR